MSRTPLSPWTPDTASGDPAGTTAGDSPPTLSLVMPTIAWDATFRQCVEAALAQLQPGDQALVVFDGMPPPPPAWLIASGAVLLHTGSRSGPAAARNLGAQNACNSILLFVDADVELHANAISRIREHFCADPHLTALFGSYDANPPAPGLVSRFRNLLHHYTQTSHPGTASTFWAGCGAVRRERFLALGGFDGQAYPQPSIEDIEFGLRLHDAGGRILLDPAIQGTHHKRWTLGLMLRTDIQQRAIPWSRLLLSRDDPTTPLNLDPTAKVSSLLVLLTLLTGAAIPFHPSLWPIPLASLGSIIVLNREFYGLCVQRGGVRLALAAIGLHGLYFLYSLLCFGWVVMEQKLGPRWRTIQWGLLALLLIASLLSLMHGMNASLTHPKADLITRFREYTVFSNGLYPMAFLVPHPVAENFPYSVYPPYALPMFALFFGMGGVAQGWAVVWALSIVSLSLISLIGWRTLRFAGPVPALLGAVAPLAISGNSYCLFMGQFSILCMGLISLQWLLLNRQKPMAAGLCWAAAMLKPQIALAFAFPFLRRPHRKGLLVGLAALLGLGAGALAHTNVSPLRYLLTWFHPDGFRFAHAGTMNLMHLLGAGKASLLLLLLPLAGFVGMRLLAKGNKLQAAMESISRVLERGSPTLRLQALCGVLGSVVFYHHPYDNIMLYPALLAIFGLALRKRGLWTTALAIIMAITLWAPLHWVANSIVFQTASTAVWILVGLNLLFQPSPIAEIDPLRKDCGA